MKLVKAFMLLVVLGAMAFTSGCHSHDDNDAEVKIGRDKIKVDVDD